MSEQNYEEYWENKLGKDVAKEERKAIEEIFDSTINEYHISYIELDQEIEVEKVEATNSHGYLTIKLPKINKTLEKKVEIKFI